MLKSVGLMLALAQLAWGQGPGVQPESPSFGAPVEVIQPEAVTPDLNGSMSPPDKAELSPPRFWVRSEYLYWFNKAGPIPALITTGLATDKIPGALDNPNTKILYGGTVEYKERNGGRFSLGYFLDDDNRFAIEGDYLFLGMRAVTSQQTSAGNPVLSRPFFDVVNNRQDASLSAYPGLISGSVTVRATNSLEAAEGSLAMKLIENRRWQLDGLAGFRYWRLYEDLSIDENTKVNPAAPVYAGQTIQVSDFFATENSFYGGQLGLRGRYQVERLQLELVAKVALGCSQEIAIVRGATGINTVPATAANAGLLALASNSGRFFHDEFTAIPEIGLNLGFRITDHIQLFAGYTFMYWANVLRPGALIDTSLNPNLIPTSNTFGVPGGPARPAFTFHESGFWAQGLNLGIEVRY